MLGNVEFNAVFDKENKADTYVDVVKNLDLNEFI